MAALLPVQLNDIAQSTYTNMHLVLGLQCTEPNAHSLHFTCIPKYTRNTFWWSAVNLYGYNCYDLSIMCWCNTVKARFLLSLRKSHWVPWLEWNMIPSGPRVPPPASTWESREDAGALRKFTHPAHGEFPARTCHNHYINLHDSKLQLAQPLWILVETSKDVLQGGKFHCTCTNSSPC